MAVLVEGPYGVLGVLVAVLGGPHVPFHRLPVVLFHAVPALVHLSEVVLSHDVPLGGRLRVQLEGLPVVLFHAPAFPVHRREVALGVHLPEVGGHGVPHERLAAVALHAQGVLVRVSQVVRCVHVAHLRRFGEALEGARLVLVHPVPCRIQEAEVVDGPGAALVSGHPVQPCRLSAVLLDAEALVVEVSQVALRLRITHVGGPFVPFGGLLVGLREAQASLVEVPDASDRLAVPHGDAPHVQLHGLGEALLGAFGLAQPSQAADAVGVSVAGAGLPEGFLLLGV